MIHLVPGTLAAIALKVSAPAFTLGILGQARAGQARVDNPDAQLFEDLLGKHRQAIYRVAYRLCGNEDDAQDLVQESAVDALVSFRSFRSGTRFDRWMAAVVTHNFIDGYRARSKWQVESLDEACWDGEAGHLEVPDVRSDPGRLIEAGELDEPVQRALDALTPEYRVTVVLCDIAGLSYQEIATALKVPVGTVRSRINRARGVLRKRLAAYARERYRL
jgi:RNA polymerase sigma-70 factor, ECF subfamily